MMKAMLVSRGTPAIPPPSLGSTAAVWWAGDIPSATATGDPISSWTDRVNSKVASNTLTARPTYVAAGIGAQPSLRFDGTDDALHWVAFEAPSVSAQGCVIAVVSMDAPTGGANTICVSADHASATRFNTFRRFNTGDVLEAVQRSNDTADRVVSGAAIPESTPTVLEWSSSGTAYELRIDNSVQSLTVLAGSNTGDWFGDTVGRDGFTIGADRRDTITNPFKGDIAFLAVLNAPLSSDDRTSLYAWIHQQYGITVA